MTQHTLTAADVGRRLEAARAARGLTKVAVAKMVGQKKQVVGRWFLGQRLPSTSTIVKLARALDVTVDSLLGVDSSLTE